MTTLISGAALQTLKHFRICELAGFQPLSDGTRTHGTRTHALRIYTLKTDSTTGRAEYVNPFVATGVREHKTIGRGLGLIFDGVTGPSLSVRELDETAQQVGQELSHSLIMAGKQIADTINERKGTPGQAYIKVVPLEILREISTKFTQNAEGAQEPVQHNMTVMICLPRHDHALAAAKKVVRAHSL